MKAGKRYIFAIERATYSRSTLPLPELVRECNVYIQAVTAGGSSASANLEERIGRLIPTIAQRKGFGPRKPEQSPSREGPSKEDLGCWEVENFNILELPNIKDARTRREQRKLLGQRLQKLGKLIVGVKEVQRGSERVGTRRRGREEAAGG